MRALDTTTLNGLWSAVATPWTTGGDIDEGALQRNCQKLASAGVDGIYTSDSDGEFYAIERDEFQQLATIFGKAMDQTEVDAAMGVTWSSTQGIIDRIKIACDVGIPNFHVAFPFFMPLAKSDIERFWEDLANAAPEARWVHYAHPRCGPPLTGFDYARLAKLFPEQFIGSKLATSVISELTEIMNNSGHLAHFTTDPSMAVGMMLGAKGCYSYWVNTLPQWHIQYMNACKEGNWDKATQYHKKLIDWESKNFNSIRDAGYRHGIVGKARATLTGWLEDSGITRPPYYPVLVKMQRELKQAFDEYWAPEITAENF